MSFSSFSSARRAHRPGAPARAAPVAFLRSLSPCPLRPAHACPLPSLVPLLSRCVSSVGRPPAAGLRTVRRGVGLGGRFDTRGGGRPCPLTAPRPRARPTAPGAAMRRKRVARRRRIQAPLRSQMVTTPAPPRPLTAATPGAPRQGTPRASGRPASRRGGGGAVPSPPAVPGGGVRPPTARPRSVRGAGRQDAPGRLQRRLHLSLSPSIGASSPLHTASPRPGSGRPHWSRRQQTRGGHPLWPRRRTTRGCRRLR